MDVRRLQGILRVLSVGAAVIYWVVLLAGVALLIGIPAPRLMERDDFMIGVPAEVAGIEAGLVSEWGAAPGAFELDDVAATLAA